MTDIVEIPRLKDNGAYNARDLYRYLNECREKGVSRALMASQLNVPMHRVIYATGLGLEHFKKAAQ